MEAHDHLNKYGIVKEPYVFKATEDLVRQKHMMQLEADNKNTPVATFSPWRFIFMSVVAISIFGGAWLLFGDNTPASSQAAENDLMVVAEQTSADGEFSPKDPQKQVLVPVSTEGSKEEKVAEKSAKIEESKEISPAVVLEKVSEEVTEDIPERIPEKIVEAKNELKAIDSSVESEQKAAEDVTSLENVSYHWVVFSAESALEADRKIQEFAKGGVNVIPLSAKAAEGKRIRLIWNKKFNSFESALAEKDKLPAIFGDDAWILKVN